MLDTLRHWGIPPVGDPGQLGVKGRGFPERCVVTGQRPDGGLGQVQRAAVELADDLGVGQVLQQEDELIALRVVVCSEAAGSGEWAVVSRRPVEADLLAVEHEGPGHKACSLVLNRGLEDYRLRP